MGIKLVSLKILKTKYEDESIDENLKPLIKNTIKAVKQNQIEAKLPFYYMIVYCVAISLIYDFLDITYIQFEKSNNKEMKESLLKFKELYELESIRIVSLLQLIQYKTLYSQQNESIVSALKSDKSHGLYSKYKKSLGASRKTGKALGLTVAAYGVGKAAQYALGRVSKR